MQLLNVFLNMVSSFCWGFGLLYILICPFTKVEESFNMHAVYDIIHNSAIWDHEIYPGPVHRTFVGNWILGVLSFIPCQIINSFYNGVYLGILQQIVVRIMLYFINILALYVFSTRLLGYKNNFLLLTSTQFHLPFYISRTIPNSFAFPLVILGLTDWIGSMYDDKLTRNAIRLIVFASIIFRCEVVVLLLGIALIQFIQGRGVTQLIGIVIYDTFIALTMTVAVDSWCWGTITWPEMSGFIYNVVFNKSSHWGSSPFYQYGLDIFKICNLSLLFLPFSWKEQLSYKIGFLAAFVIGCMSLLNHKEWRFIMYIIPLINVLSSIGMNEVQQRLGKWRQLVYLIPLGQLFLSFLFVFVSSYNYAGGYAGLSFAGHTKISEPVQLWKHIGLDIVHPIKVRNESIWIDFRTKQIGATLFVYPNYTKIHISEKREPFYLTLGKKTFLEHVNVPDEEIKSDYKLTSNLQHNSNAEWCIKGYKRIGWHCPGLICTENISCLYKSDK